MMFAFSLASWPCSANPLLLPGQGNDAMALLLFMLVLPVFTFLFGPLTSLSSRKHEFEADAFAATHRGARPGVGAGQDVRGQCLDADARPAALGLLRLAPAGQRAHPPTETGGTSMRRAQRTATIIAAHGRHYLAEADGLKLQCVTRGKKTNVAVGDRVHIT
jgi:hypothetical protein